MISYNELLQKYNAALKTITDLQAENRQLKARLGISEIAPAVPADQCEKQCDDDAIVDIMYNARERLSNILDSKKDDFTAEEIRKYSYVIEDE